MRPSDVLLRIATVPFLGRATVGCWRLLRGERAIDHWLFRPLAAKCGATVLSRFQIASSAVLECDALGYIAACLRRDAVYEPVTTRVWQTLIDKQAVVIDVGANAGYFTVLAAVTAENVSVHAFEPDPRTFETLKRNIASNRISARANMLALAERSGTANLILGESGDTNSLARTAHSSDGSILVPLETLDRYCELNGVHRVDVMKIDVEGAERSVLLGARSAIARFSPAIIAEVGDHSRAFGYSADELVSGMEALDYEAFCLEEWPLRRWATGQDTGVFGNVLFVHRRDVDRGLLRGRIPFQASAPFGRQVASASG